MEKPVIKNKTYEFDIIDLSHEATGVAKIDKYTVFVEGGIPGDKLEARVTTVKKNYAIARRMRLIKPSEHRVKPICPVAFKCGGCQIMDIEYSEQLRLKQDRINQELRRNGLEDILVEPIIGMEDPYHYRNKAQYPVGEKDGKIEMGFYKKKSHEIVDTDHCYIQHEMNDKILQTIKEFMEVNNIKSYNEEKQSGLIRHILTKTSFRTNDIMIVVVINDNKLPLKEKLVKMLTEKIPEIKSIYININKRNTNVILGHKSIKIYGDDYLVDYIDDLSFSISPESFFQVNPKQTEKLYHEALKCADLKGDENVFDLYCGIGTISLFLAQKAKFVHGIEIVPKAIENAIQNASTNNISNVKFHKGTAEEIFPKLYEEGNTADVVVVDPPRKGCDQEVLDTIVSMSPAKVVYVSCNPASLARDIAYLKENGYKAKSIQPVDLFPHSLHVESVTVLTR